jgi:hypothetical protein
MSWMNFQMNELHGIDILNIRPFFAFAHFHALHCFSTVFFSCFFFSLANDTHIVDLAQVVSFVFDHFAS